MRDRKGAYIVAGALFVLIVFGLMGLYSPSSGQDSQPVNYMPFVSYHPTRAVLMPALIRQPTPTPTPTSTPTPSPTPTAVPAGPNLLPNPSFEEGWYHPNGIPELQIPNEWIFEWDEGYNPLDPDHHDFVRPEVRVLPRDQLPVQERDLFVWDGNYTVKVFKGYGAVSFRLKTSTYLQAGSYQLEINVFPDLVESYSGGQKIWASDPKSGEVNLTADGQSTGWIFPTFGQKNTIRYTFNVSQGKVVSITAAFRGRYPLLNNGWFMDDWRLVRLP